MGWGNIVKLFTKLLLSSWIQKLLNKYGIWYFLYQKCDFYTRKKNEVTQKLNKIHLGVQFIALHMLNKRSFNKSTCKNVTTAVSAIVFQTSHFIWLNTKLHFFPFSDVCQFIRKDFLCVEKKSCILYTCLLWVVTVFEFRIIKISMFFHHNC